jgi:TRAP-type C4-dicarboxylate transport system permease small subunit
MLIAVDRLIAGVAWAMAVIAGMALLLIALIIMTEVVMRAMRNSLVGGIEMIRLTFVISVFFAFAHVIVSEREIRVDVMRYVIPRASLRILDAAASLVTCLFFTFLVWFSVGRLVEAWERGIFLEGQLLLPMWIPWGTIVLGSAMALAASMCSIVKYLANPPRDPDPLIISAATRQVV